MVIRLSAFATLLCAALLSAASSSLPFSSSTHNYQFSYYKPSKNNFVENAKHSYLPNTRWKIAYDKPADNPGNSLLYAVAMDYVHGDSSEEVRKLYESAAFSSVKLGGYFAILQYPDFLIRTGRYKLLIDTINPEMCRPFSSQCSYYIAVAKHLANIPISDAECKAALQFGKMRNTTLTFCK